MTLSRLQSEETMFSRNAEENLGPLVFFGFLRSHIFHSLMRRASLKARVAEIHIGMTIFILMKGDSN